MHDYYHLRFRNLLGARRPVGVATIRSVYVIPLYTGAIGLMTGAWLGYGWISEDLRYSSAVGVNDLVSAWCVAALLGSILGTVGRWLGDLLVHLTQRAA